MTEEHKEEMASCCENAALEELKEYKDKYLRTLAEMENSRKRLTKEKQDSVRFATDSLLVEILPPIDNLENALKFSSQMSDETRQWAEGFKMILHQFKEVLHHHGVMPYPSLGQQFDPHFHDAVEMEETDLEPEGTILQEFLQGYKSGDHVLRHARVKVAKKKEK